ncbi:HyaD/HybD family hydrogenase maturation endopeptidase [Rhodoblastus acidophilus]|uniref:HyaD/HybD family hydrogenase maturation endopeptidase n=1 Tax=Candidatus Rhodoblastus alkanivorans TaxID=2954117 RepID=A0ABS9Z2A5_9HYPH|nr:HyaD/HybD family hydrogenase maturation endopeptidase [Candidatus Rhodoblastus alkanivorans]MCI4677445.1 HyaD/HybD family hydrogenase maturation endopeptidase [Candidatus Rhodoblastus alkanivorans]MCI4681804.1 HyaD/HybD family hydrogenase maturation endopeptidase [Candidatus Rhodoblastus alkanivorans]MDI4642854.1 HyaD/HybD family hydrogenase maturation endopeptidase [Rhodoblastus acidophilus]
MEARPQPTILVLGIGNILWADEGFGVRALETFNALYATPKNVSLLDGGTQGLYLVQFVEAADYLLVFDAIDYGLEPGSLKIVQGDEVPKFTGAKKMSLHQTGFQEVLSAADLLGSYPEKLALIGCQPLDLEDWGGPLTAPVRDRLLQAAELAAVILDQWGAPCRRRAPGEAVTPLLGNDIDLHNYETRMATIRTGG